MSGHSLRNSPSRLKLGMFAFNCSGGTNPSTLDRDYHVSWGQTSSIAKLAEEIGMEFVVPISKWRGMGGETDFWGTSYETLTWAAGIAAQTKSITVTSTVHVPIVHPTFAAKAVATLDHISGGRAALNVVMGWYPPELNQFGLGFVSHEDRYGYGHEWLDLLERIWTETEPFDHESKHFKAQGVLSKPKPIEKPLLINAGSSDAGLDFSAKYCDFNFATAHTVDKTRDYVKKAKGMARERYGREMGVVNMVQVSCAPTEKEAKDRQQKILEAADRKGVETMLTMMGQNTQSYDDIMLEHRELMVNSTGGIAIVGTPEQVVEQMGELAEAGTEGLAIGMFDYQSELKFFGDEVMPLLRKAGLHA
ncbi:LLM class flavin-dependent oxidoreductase [Flavisphingomonas formosensis]|uniref:LLM class flavin-dependent oxidoreductase n=1 Tax=Flavisphingomonas formosensis TaxID=861534 RepID=UPI0012F84B68|nr:LLM class flavin-dependent oxidoreductase [Sphingomonas formosensis]